jgi:hypothetical protein
MELNESLIITFLLIVIVILIFSNITVSLGNSSDTNNQPDNKNRSGNIKKPVATERPKLYKVNNDLLSDDVKKQLNTLNNQFYFNDCRV